MNFKNLNAKITPFVISALLIPNFVFGQTNTAVNLSDNMGSINETVKLPNYVRDLTEEARAGQIRTISEYQAEADEIVDSLNGSANKNVILVDKTVVQFDVLVNEVALRLTQNTPTNLLGKKLWRVDLNRIMAENDKISQAVSELNKILLNAENGRVIVAIENVVNNAGKIPYSAEIAQVLRGAAKRGKVRILSASSISEFETQITADSEMSKYFARVEVKMEDNRYKFVGDKISPDLQEMIQNST
ncbi:MAG TPA: hypothetical protein PKE69_25850, partial [Pyrinomonadaceae bacterium]|nr:hypothetical protein [Pyrinomonadaceae bacterium]